jgi:Uma2 family endonuclease
LRTPPVQTRHFTRAEYDRLIEQGFFDEDERIELLDGLLVVREPQGSEHSATVSGVGAALQRAFGPRYHVRFGAPVALDDASEPEPDLAVVRGRPFHYRDEHPSRPVLVVEVARTSLTKDRRRKGPLYARADVADYWIVNLAARVLEVYRGPIKSAAGRWKYKHVRLLKPGTVVRPLAAPDARIRVADLLP